MDADNAVVAESAAPDSRDAQIAALQAEIEQLKAERTPAVGNEHEIASANPEQQYPGNCYKDYCPCDPPQEGMDQVLCDQLEEGVNVDVQMMIAGRGAKEARRQLQEFEREYGAF